MNETKRPLRVFLCHSSGDKSIVRELYQKLMNEGWLDVWLDEEKLLPGQDWNLEIEKAVEATDVIIVCLSNNSITKEGYVQRELKYALDIALEKPEGTIFVIPLRLESCEPPRRLRGWQYADYFPENLRVSAYQSVLESLKARADSIGTAISLAAKDTRTSSQVVQVSGDNLEIHSALGDQGPGKRHQYIPPKTYPQFVGREDEKQLLMNALRSPKSQPMVAIVGLGGMGKTTLAREVIDICLEEEIFQGIVWAGFKTELFMGEGIRYIEESSHSFDTLVNDIIRQCGTEDISKIPPDKRRTFVKELLEEKRILIVLDNLETIQDNEELIDSVFKILGQGKLLITSRYFVKHEYMFTIRLGGFSEDDGVRLLRMESKARGIGYVERAARTNLVTIQNVTGGNPLAIKLVIGQMSLQPMEVVLNTLEQASPKGQDYEFFCFLYLHSWELLDMKARMVWVDISIFPPLVGGAAQDVEAVSQIKPPDFWPALGKLVQMNLVDKIGNVGAERFALHPLSQYFIRSDITKEWAGPPER